MVCGAKHMWQSEVLGTTQFDVAPIRGQSVPTAPRAMAACSTCSTAIATLDPWQYKIRVSAILLLDVVLKNVQPSGEPEDEVVSGVLSKAADVANAKRRAAREAKAREEAEKARAEKEAIALANKAEKEAVKAAEEAAKAVAKAKAKEAADAKKAAQERDKELAEAEKEAAAEAKARAAEWAKREKEAAAAAKAEAAAKAKADKEAAAKAKAEEKAEEKAAAEARKAAAEEARQDALQAMQDAEAVAKRQLAAEKEASAEAPAPAAAAASPGRSTASNISQQRLDRAMSRMSIPKPPSVGNPLASLPKPGRRRSSSLDDDDGEKFDLLTTKTKAAARGLKEDGPSGRPSRDSLAETSALNGAESIGALLSSSGATRGDALLEAWRGCGGMGMRSAELSAYCGFQADCLALDDDGDGDTLVSIGGNGDGKLVCTYSMSKGVALTEMHGHTDKICSVAIDGDTVASGGRDKTIRCWSRSTGRCKWMTSACSDLVLGLSLRGDLLLSGEGVKSNSKAKAKARLWSVDDGTMLAVYAEHSASIMSVALGSGVAVSASHDTTVRIWPVVNADDADSKNSTPSRASLKHPQYVHCVSVDGQVCATGCGDGRARLWSLVSNACLVTVEHGPLPLSCVRLLGGALATAGEDKNFKVWSLLGGASPVLVATLSQGDAKLNNGIALAATGRIACACATTGSGGLVIWEPKVVALG